LIPQFVQCHKETVVVGIGRQDSFANPRLAEGIADITGDPNNGNAFARQKSRRLETGMRIQSQHHGGRQVRRRRLALVVFDISAAPAMKPPVIAPERNSG
jgi:hypothetical protein